MITLYRFCWGPYRGGCVESIFAADDAIVKATIGKELAFGEILGKHSEVMGTLEEGDLEVLSTDEAFITQFSSIVGSTGYNPLNYIAEGQQDE